MSLPRRALILLVLMLASPLLSLGAARAQDEVAVYKAAVEASFAKWLQALWPDAEAMGISRAVFDANVKGLKLVWALPHLVYPDPAAPGGPPLPKVLADQMKPSRQPEFEPPAGYFNAGTLNALAASGRSRMAQLAPQLAAMQKEYSVPASIVVAIWGRETGFGKVDMPFDALSAIATQGFMGRRPDEFRNELLVALKILQEQHATRAMMKSSWAGAMGYTQFLPSDFDKYGVDFDGDGKRDIWGTVVDALASTANSLHSQGWNGTETWGYEVKLPDKFDCTLQGPDKALPIAEWVKLGVARVKDRPFPQERLNDQAFLVLPAGLKGPAFLATNNFSVLKLYNNSDVYAIFVGHVADMISQNAPAEFVGTWQPVESFPRDRIQRFQEVLVAQGYDVGKVDGLAGFKTRRTIGVEEKKRGLPLSCYPSSALVNAVLKEASAAAN
ncbi:lytic murein transglycosylase [Methyloceanibacter sp.]|uniref:lytic murein transglycosylase n=1 Tax=Methyloceanibacter sp. TaxID=1965321 RepID=UPI002D30ECFB|nr:lytic murein transglycosylase [Methyloceanibacter sp.]HZP10246.1 lytic murein transglycosylase [Methyloceanibacter sp.]